MNKEVIEVIKISFDNLENRISDAIIKESIGMFSSSDTSTPVHGVVAKYINELPPVNLYMGWDGDIYPQYRTVKHVTRS